MDVKIERPLLPLRDIVVFPNMVIPLFVGRDKSIAALNEVMKKDKKIVLVTQKNSEIDDPKKTDVRFSVHGSPFYKPVKLNGIMLRHREDFEAELNINITMVGIDECLYENENCEGSCTNNLEISSVPYMVDANKTALVSILTHYSPLIQP